MHLPSIFKTEEDNPQDRELPTGQEVMVYAFMVFMVLKTLAFDLSFFGYIKRYKETYGTCNQVEIWLLLLAAFKLTVLLPDYFMMEINYLFYIYAFNTLCTFWLSHILHLRGCIIRKVTACTARGYMILFISKIVILAFLVYISPIFEAFFSESHEENDFYDFMMTCTIPPVYRKSFSQPQ